MQAPSPKHTNGRNNVARTRAAERAQRLADFQRQVETGENGLTVRQLSAEDIAQLERARARRRQHPEGG
jgi:hypothetical protein